MKKITPKKVPFEKYLEFVKKIRDANKAGDNSWYVENRYGWGFSTESKKRFKQLKDDPDPIFLELDLPGKYDPYYRYALVSDKAKYAITISHQHVKDLIKSMYPDIELDIPDYDGTPDYKPLKNS